MKLQELANKENPKINKKIKMVITEKQFNLIAQFIFEENFKKSLQKVF